MSKTPSNFKGKSRSTSPSLGDAANIIVGTGGSVDRRACGTGYEQARPVSRRRQDGEDTLHHQASRRPRLDDLFRGWSVYSRLNDNATSP